MICQICKQKKATAHYVQVIGSGDVLDLVICEDCAKKLIKSKNRATSKGSLNNNSRLISGNVSGDNGLFCPSCGKTLDHFIVGNYKGCPECPKSFKLHLGSINKLFESSQSQSTIKELQEAMNRAIDDERFEDAANIRDQIKKRHSKK